MTQIEMLRKAIVKQLEGVPEVSNLCEAAWDLFDAVRNEAEAELVLEDFNGGLSIKDAEKVVHSWCDQNHGKAKVAGCPRYIARREIRKAFGLPTEADAGTPAERPKGEVATVEPVKKEPEKAAVINLLDFL